MDAQGFRTSLKMANVTSRMTHPLMNKRIVMAQRHGRTGALTPPLPPAQLQQRPLSPRRQPSRPRRPPRPPPPPRSPPRPRSQQSLLPQLQCMIAGTSPMAVRSKRAQQWSAMKLASQLEVLEGYNVMMVLSQVRVKNARSCAEELTDVQDFRMLQQKQNAISRTI